MVDGRECTCVELPKNIYIFKRKFSFTFGYGALNTQSKILFEEKHNKQENSPTLTLLKTKSHAILFMCFSELRKIENCWKFHISQLEQKGRKIIVDVKP